MALPTIQFKGTNVHVDSQWEHLVEQKFSTLGKYLGNETDTKCEVEFEKIASHQTGQIHRVEANLFASGKLHRAEATEFSFEVAIDAVKNELDRELAKNNEKQETLFKKGGRKIKEMLRFGK